jgi:hypothetical protein
MMGWCPGIYICVGICGRVMHRDLWSYIIVWARTNAGSDMLVQQRFL